MSTDEQANPPSDIQPQSARHASPSRARLWYFGVPLVLALAVLSGVLIYLVGGGQPRAAASSAGPTSAATSASPAAPVKPVTVLPPGGVKGQAALTALGSNALPLPKKVRTSAKAWNADRGGTELNAVTSNLGGVMQAAGARNYVVMKSACKTLAAEVRAAQASPPIPDAGLQALYGKALAEVADGAAACQAAITQRSDGDEYNVTTENQAELHRATSEFAAGAKDMYRATAEIEAVSRR